MAGVALKALPPVEALAYFRSKGLAPPDARFDYRDVWREEHASSFVVAKAMRDDVLQLIRRELEAAMADGRGLKGFQQDLRPKLQSAGWWGKAIDTDPLTGETREVQRGSMHRLRTIFHTNMATSAAVGRWAQLQRTRHAFPYLRYQQLDRPSKRPQHARFHDKVWHIDDPVWERIYPPNGWFCACSVSPITQGQIDRGEYQVSPPLDLDETWQQNYRTGEDELVPDGVTPGFDINPGAVWLNMRDRMEGLEGHPHHPELVAVGFRLRLDVMREGFERGAFILPDKGVRYPVQGTQAEPGRLIVGQDADDIRGADFIHSHPSEAALSPQDVLTMFGRELKTMTAVTPGGSVFSAAPGESVFDDKLNIAVLTRLYLDFKVELAKLPRAQASDVLNEVFLRALERRGIISYHEQASGAYRDGLAELDPLIERMLARWPR